MLTYEGRQFKDLDIHRAILWDACDEIEPEPLTQEAIELIVTADDAGEADWKVRHTCLPQP